MIARVSFVFVVKREITGFAVDDENLQEMRRGRTDDFWKSCVHSMLEQSLNDGVSTQVRVKIKP